MNFYRIKYLLWNSLLSRSNLLIELYGLYKFNKKWKKNFYDRIIWIVKFNKILSKQIWLIEQNIEKSLKVSQLWLVTIEKLVKSNKCLKQLIIELMGSSVQHSKKQSASIKYINAPIYKNKMMYYSYDRQWESLYNPLSQWSNKWLKSN